MANMQLADPRGWRTNALTVGADAVTTEATIWLTGLSGAGKTTIADALAGFLRTKGVRAAILDGAAVREELGDFFGYSREERMKVNRVLCAMAKVLTRHGVVAIVTAITPYQDSRDFNRRELGRYVEIYVECPLEICIERDRAGLYTRALRGDLKHVIGVDDEFEVPRRSDLRISTATEPPEHAAARAVMFVSNVLGLNVTP